MATFKNTEINDTGFVQLPTGNTSQRPLSPQNGQTRFNTDIGSVEWYDAEYNVWLPTGVIYPVATGGTITNITVGNAGFRVHTFTGSGTLTVTRAGIFEYLIVGGGGGGADVSGGGAGGVLTGHTRLEPGSYSIAIASATGNTGDNVAPGLQGNPTTAFGLTAAGGGGGGGGFGSGLGIDGGSGGGGGRNPGGTIKTLGGRGVAGQGHRGGHYNGSGDWEGGGGGGAGCSGRNGINADWGGDGGHGIASIIRGTAIPVGGGGGWSGVCGGGGSGLVVVRYRTG